MSDVPIKDGEGVLKDFFGTQDSNGLFSLIATSRSFELAVQMGQVSGFSTVDKFGYNPSVTTGSQPEDVWEGGGIYPYDDDDTAPIVTIGSSSAIADNGIPIIITGLNANGDEVVQTITLGLTPQSLTTPLGRVYRMEVDGSDEPTGSIFCYTGTGAVPSIGDAEVRAVITVDNNQTEMALYTIPKGKVGFLYLGEVGMQWEGGAFTGTENITFRYRSRRFGGVFKNKKTITLNSTAGPYINKRSFPDIIPSRTDVKLNIKEVTDGMGGYGAFDILLVDESYFPDSYLTAIGQYGY